MRHTHFRPTKIEIEKMDRSIYATAGTLYIAPEERAVTKVSYKDPEKKWSRDTLRIAIGVGDIDIEGTHQHAKEIVEGILSTMTDEDAQILINAFLEKSALPQDVV